MSDPEIILTWDYDKLLKWLAYFQIRPFGWQEDDRTFKLLQVQGVKGRPGDYFASLKPFYNPPITTNSLKGLKGSYMYQLLLSAKGGEVLPVLGDL